MIYKRSGHWHLDVTVQGVRYREALDTTDKRVAKELEKDRVAAIKQGKGASKAGRQFARLPFGIAADLFVDERKPHVSERTAQLDRERLRPLRLYFGETPLLRITASEVSAYQRARMSGQILLKTKALNTVGNRTINMEVTVLRQMMRRGKVWSAISEDVKMLPERHAVIGRVLTREQKELLFKVAGSRGAWMVAHCAAALAASTTCRGVELKNLRWRDVNLFTNVLTVRRSKTEAGQRTIPLNNDGTASLARLLDRARANEATDPQHHVFPACENDLIDPNKPQKTWRTAWRSLVKETAYVAGRDAALEALATDHRLSAAKAAWRRASSPFPGLRFHDLRHQAITELAERGASDATVMALAGHMSRAMMEHYSHVRMEAKRAAVDGLATGLIQQRPEEQVPLSSVVQ